LPEQQEVVQKMSAQLQLAARKPLGVLDPELDSSEDEAVYVDPRTKYLELKRLAAGGAAPCLWHELPRWQGSQSWRADPEAGADPGPDVSSIASTVEAEWDPDDPEAPCAGDCERSWLHHGKIQAVVIAMAQGLVRVCEEPYQQVLYVFDMDKDDLVVKNCPQKNQMLPVRKHLVVDEALRRAAKPRSLPERRMPLLDASAWQEAMPDGRRVERPWWSLEWWILVM
jgi:hypothetical protein